MYRSHDSVIRSLNADKPFDRFAREPLAGDEIGGDEPGVLGDDDGLPPVPRPQIRTALAGRPLPAPGLLRRRQADHDRAKPGLDPQPPALRALVDLWSAGNHGEIEESTRRLARPLCFLLTDPTDNGSVRPIEGLRPVVDLNTMEVIRVERYSLWPLPPGEGNYAAARQDRFRGGIKPLEINQPDGPSFEVSGNPGNDVPPSAKAKAGMNGNGSCRH